MLNNLPKEILVEILRSTAFPLSSTLAMAHVSWYYNKTILDEFSGVGFNKFYGNALITGNAYASQQLYFIFEMDNLRYNVEMEPMEIMDTFHSGYDVGYTKNIKLLIESGNLDLLKWFYSINTDLSDPPKKYERLLTEFVEHAAFHNNLQIVEWYLKYEYVRKNIVHVAYGAARGAHINLLRWYRNNMGEWSTEICNRAAIGGSVSALSWLREEGCPWDEHGTRYYAARSGKLDMLIWCYEMCKLEGVLSKYISHAAIESGNLAMVVFCKKNCLEWETNKNDAVNRASASNHLHIFKWLIETGFECPSFAMRKLISNGNLAVVKQLVDKGYLLDKYTLTDSGMRICVKGHFELFKFCMEHGCKWSDASSYDLAESGNLDLLKYYVEKGYALGENICIYAAISGNLDMFKYCSTIYPDSIYNVCDNAAIGGNLETLKYCRNIGFRWSASTCINAFFGYKFKMVKWAIENGCPCPNYIKDILNKL